jgi:hypothetical protein
MLGQSRKRRMVVAVLVIIATPLLTIAIAGLWLFWWYVHVEPAGAETAAREFAAVRARLAKRAPLIEYRGLEAPVVRRNPEAPRHELRTVHVLVYDAGEGELTRGVFPVRILRTMTLGGRIRLMGSGFLGDRDERITLDDLERHGPGLILDSADGAPGVLSVADAMLGTKSAQSRLLIWTE